MRDFAGRIRAGEYTESELEEQEEIFRDLAEATDFSDRIPAGPADAKILHVLASSRAAARIVLDAIDDYRASQAR